MFRLVLRQRSSTATPLLPVGSVWAEFKSVTLDVSGGSGTNTYGIDDDIVEVFEDATGYHGFLLTIPQPTSNLMLAIGSAVQLVRRR